MTRLSRSTSARQSSVVISIPFFYVAYWANRYGGILPAVHLDDALFDDQLNTLFLLQNPDIRQRVAVNQQQVRSLTGLYAARQVVERQIFGGLTGAALDGIHQKHHLVYEKLYDTEIFVLLGPGNPFYTAEAEDISLEELQDYNFITYVDEDSNAFWQELFLGDHKRMKVFVNSVETMTELLRRTPSYTIETYSLDLFRQAPYFRQMRFLRLRNTDTRCEYGIIRPRDMVLSPMEETFLTQLREAFAELSR